MRQRFISPLVMLSLLVISCGAGKNGRIVKFQLYQRIPRLTSTSCSGWKTFDYDRSAGVLQKTQLCNKQGEDAPASSTTYILEPAKKAEIDANLDALNLNSPPISDADDFAASDGVPVDIAFTTEDGKVHEITLAPVGEEEVSDAWQYFLSVGGITKGLN